MEKFELAYTAGRNAKHCNHIGKQSRSSKKNVKHSYHMTQCSISRYIHKRIRIYVHKKTATLFIIAKNVVKKKKHTTKCSSTDECMNKMCYFHIMEYYSSTKRNEAPIRATTLVSFENIVLSKLRL